MVGLALAAVLLASCGSGEDRPEGPRKIGAAPRLASLADDAPYDKPVTLDVRGGTIEEALVSPEGGDPLAGSVNDDGQWVSDDLPEPGTSYKVDVTAGDGHGATYQLTDELGVAGVPDGNRLTLAMQPGDGEVVGVGAPITIKFDQEVTNQAAVEKNMHVASSPQTTGSWHWLSSTEAHFRPKEYWEAGTKVAVNLDLNGVEAGDDLWGGRSYDMDFEIGDSRVAKVDAATHTMSMVVNGNAETTWKTSLGDEGFETRNGNYIVLEKHRKKTMTSCSANITCDKKDEDFYDLEVDFSVRLTWSGTFVHAAPWSSGDQGVRNVSHGCLNLSEADGEAYFNSARYGDVVTVVNSTRGPEDLVERGDPGMADWNLDWDSWVDGSAVGKEITTDKL